MLIFQSSLTTFGVNLICKIQARRTTSNREYPYPYSLDVISLYTSVTVKEVIDNVAKKNRVNNRPPFYQKMKSPVSSPWYLTTSILHTIPPYIDRSEAFLCDLACPTYLPFFSWTNWKKIYIVFFLSYQPLQQICRRCLPPN